MTPIISTDLADRNNLAYDPPRVHMNGHRSSQTADGVLSVRRDLALRRTAALSFFIRP